MGMIPKVLSLCAFTTLYVSPKMRLQDKSFTASQLLKMPVARAKGYRSMSAGGIAIAKERKRESHVYVLELVRGYIYVGKSTSIQRSVQRAFVCVNMFV